MSAASASTGIAAAPGTVQGVPSVASPSSSRPVGRKRAPGSKSLSQQEEVDVSIPSLPPSGRVVRRKELATSSANGDVLGSEVGALTQPREPSPGTLGDRPIGQVSKQKNIALPSASGRPGPIIKKVKTAATSRDVPGVTRRHSSSFLDVAGHLFSRFFVLFVLGVGLGTSFYNWKVRPQIAETSGILSTEVEKLEEFVTKTTKWMQVQLELVDIKVGQEVGNLRREVLEEFSKQQLQLDTEVQGLKDNIGKVSVALESLLRRESPLTRREALDLIKDVVDKRAAEGEGHALSLDDVRTAAKQIVLREIERHSADGIGRVDYALASGGGRVVEHSEGYFQGRGGDWRNLLSILPGTNRRNGLSNKVLEPSFGEPGQCLPLKGSDVWVDISLRTSIRADAISVEHVSTDVAYDISSAPKDIRVYGWLEYRGQVDKASETRSQRLLGQFMYDITKASVQTFAINEDDLASELVNMVRVHVLSNHGSPSHTCIYRIRVHGSEPQMVEELAASQ